MGSPDRQQRLAALRDTIADIERRPALLEARSRVELTPGDFPALGGGLLQEIFTDERRNAGAALGFALAQARGLIGAARPGVIFLQLAAESQKLGLPYGPGLVSFGFDPAALILVRVEDVKELLWAAEQALGCRAVAAVVADIGAPAKLLDFTASRRLSLRAAESGTSVFLLRYGTGREASAAHLRWRLAPAPSARKPYDDKAPGPVRWRAELERGVLIKQSAEWLLGWSKDGLAAVSPERGGAQRVADAAVPRAVPAQLGDGLPQTA